MGTYQVSVQALYAGQNIANVFGATTLDAPLVDTQGEAKAIAVRARDAWFGGFRNQQLDTLTFSKVVVRALNTVGLVEEEPFTGIGGRAGQGMPGFVCAKVKVTTGAFGRPNTGRMGISAISEADTSATAQNELTGLAVTALQDAANVFLVGMNAGPSIRMAVISRKGLLPGATRAYTSASVVTGLTVQSRLGSRLTRLR